MPLLAIIFGLLLDLLGIIAYVATGAQSFTALIPAIFGTIILLCGIVAKVAPGARKHVMHVAALFGLLGTLGGLGMGLPKLPSALNGSAARPAAVWTQVGMGALSLVFVGLCVKSFIDARRKKPENV